MKRNVKTAASAAGVALATIFLQVACGGSGSSGPSPSGGGVGATITITSSGVSNATPRISLGQSVRFTNNDSRPHEILTTPHGTHTDCPALNSIGSLQPGQSKESGTLDVRRGCGFHDHLSPDDQSLRGQVIVGISEGDPNPPDPGY
jgi:plastocyanin